MTSTNEPIAAGPVAYKIPRPLRARLRVLRDVYAREAGRGVTLIEALERMTAECEARHGIKHNQHP
jgi:hypothetical protein